MHTTASNKGRNGNSEVSDSYQEKMTEEHKLVSVRLMLQGKVSNAKLLNP